MLDSTVPQIECRGPIVKVLLASAICIGTLWGIDAYWFNGDYHYFLMRMVSDASRNLR